MKRRKGAADPSHVHYASTRPASTPSRATVRRLLLAFLIAAVAAVLVANAGDRATAATSPPQRPSTFEVWTVDQSDTRPDGGGLLHVYNGPSLNGDFADEAHPETTDLGGRVRQLCLERTGTAPRRPHMLVFNGGHDSADGASHAALAFVVTGHVVFFDAATREPLACIDVGVQAHAVWPTPDQRHMIVANQNGKLLQRIATDYANDRFTLEPAATLNLATCTTPSGARCQDPALRPDNAPICPRTDASGRFTFVTLRGGGMFVVDHSASPMQIVAEYDRSAIHPAGCGGIEANGKMYVNSGAPHHDVYAISLDELSSSASPPNTPTAKVVYSRDDRPSVDSHGVLTTKHERYVWVADRSANFVAVVDPITDEVVY